MTRFNSINNSQGCSNRRKQTETQRAWVISILVNHIIYIPNFIVNRQQHVKGKLMKNDFISEKLKSENVKRIFVLSGLIFCFKRFVKCDHCDRIC